MALTIHAGKNSNSLFVTNENAAARRAAENDQREGKKSSIFAGDLGVGLDKIQIKRQQAQKKAMKIVGDTFAAEKELDQSMTDMAERLKVLQDETAGCHEELKRIENTRYELMGNYGVTEDSEEQADLELLRKEREANNPASNVTLDYEETKRLEKIHEKGITGYQNDMLELDEEQKVYEKNLASGEAGIKSVIASISDTKIERLKTAPMLKAQQEADEIMEAANKEIYGELINEGKEHIEEKMKEEKEQAEKRAEEKEEQEEKEEAVEERKAEMEQFIEGTKQQSEAKKEELPSELDQEQMAAYNDPNNSEMESAKEIAEILDELKLIQEDIKGAAVDTNL